MQMSNNLATRVLLRANGYRRSPGHYTFALANRPALYTFCERQSVPPHEFTKGPRVGKQHPNRLRRMERWILSRCLVALDAAGRITFPVNVAHALHGRSPDFMIRIGLNLAEGYEVTQATTTKYQRKLTRLEKPGAPRSSYGRMGGWVGYQAESYWCRRILTAVRNKLGKLAKGHYQNASAQ